MKTIVITGGNTGLGYECAKVMAGTGKWHVVLACRSPDRAADAVHRLSAETGSSHVEALALDLASLRSVRSFAATFAASNRPPLHALVCNAGLQVVNGPTFTVDGLETTFAVNHLGHFLLMNLLLRQMRAPGRVVFVSSGTHDPDRWTGMPAPRFTNAHALAHPERDPRDSAGTAGRRAYTTSKLCNVLCAYELARRLPREAGITVNAFCPGLMPGSGLGRDYDPVQRFVWNFVLPVFSLFVPNVNTTRRSGTNLASLILDPRLEGVTAKYFEGARARSSSRESYDAEKARELWDTSAELVQLTQEETPLHIGGPRARVG